VAAVVGGSAVGVIGWYLITNRTGAVIDPSGFDLSSAPAGPRPSAPAPAAPAASQPSSSLGMLRADAGIRVGGAGAAAPRGAGAAPAAAGGKKEQTQAGFTDLARKHEDEVRRYGERMTRKYPVIAQYGRDWMKHPDLRKLTEDYYRTRDPIAFMTGLARAPSLGPMLKEYGGKPEIREFVVEGVKEAPGDLTAAAMDVLSNNAAVKGLVSGIADAIGLPPSITAMIGGSAPTEQDQSKVVNDLMKGNPDMQKALQQGGQAPPVSLPAQR
jgi:hypothetical protein